MVLFDFLGAVPVNEVQHRRGNPASSVQSNELLKRIIDDPHSRIPIVFPARILVPYDVCVFCDSPLESANEGTELGAAELGKHSAHTPRYCSEEMIVAAHETTHRCSRPACAAVHLLLLCSAFDEAGI